MVYWLCSYFFLQKKKKFSSQKLEMSKHTCIFPQEKLWCKCRVWGCEIRHLLLILSRSRSNICCWSASYWAPTGQGDEACSQKLCSPLACMAWAFPKQHFLVPYDRNPNSLECFLKKKNMFWFCWLGSFKGNCVVLQTLDWAGKYFDRNSLPMRFLKILLHTCLHF